MKMSFIKVMTGQKEKKISDLCENDVICMEME